MNKQRLRLSIATLTILGLAVNAWAGAITATVSNTPVILVPAAGRLTAPDWVSNTTYVVGQTVKAMGVPWLCVGAGKSTNVALQWPTGGLASDVTDGTATWRKALNRRRAGLVVENLSTGLLSVADVPVGPLTGLVLSQNGAASISGEGVPQGPIWVLLTNSVPGAVSAWEW